MKIEKTVDNNYQYLLKTCKYTKKKKTSQINFF